MGRLLAGLVPELSLLVSERKEGAMSGAVKHTPLSSHRSSQAERTHLHPGPQLPSPVA